MSLSLIIDIVVILIVLVSAGVAFFRGFVREVLTIFGVIGGFLAALFFGGTLTPIFRGWFGVGEAAEDSETAKKLFDLIPYTIVADVCAYAAIFLAVFLILQLVSHFMSASIKAIGLGPVDRSLGVVFGIFRGVLLIGILYLPFHLILPDDNKREWFGESKTFVYVEGVSGWLQSFLPSNSDEAKAKVESFTKEKFEDITKEKVQEELDKAKDAASEKATGYSDKAREKMDSLIEEEAAPDSNPEPDLSQTPIKSNNYNE